MASTSLVSFLSEALTASKTTAKISLGPRQKAFIGWLDISANDGSTTVDAKIQHSPDGTNWVDLATFTQVVNLTGQEALQITDSIFVNVRSVVTLAGTPSATVKVQLWSDDDK
ncbi:hypothetical protein GOV11_04185 [Candidatus Woesearchaeota archaeon]|nr:hypothetical protein [Candidatus Woesearchaeota archaeon]